MPWLTTATRAEKVTRKLFDTDELIGQG